MPLLALALLSYLLVLGPAQAVVLTVLHVREQQRAESQGRAVVRLGESIEVGQAAWSVEALCDDAARHRGLTCTRTETGLVAAPATKLVVGRGPVLHVELDKTSACQRVVAVRYTSSSVLGSDDPAPGSPPPRP